MLSNAPNLALRSKADSCLQPRRSGLPTSLRACPDVRGFSRRFPSMGLESKVARVVNISNEHANPCRGENFGHGFAFA